MALKNSHYGTVFLACLRYLRNNHYERCIVRCVCRNLIREEHGDKGPIFGDCDVEAIPRAIRIADGLSVSEAIKTLIHEWAHALRGNHYHDKQFYSLFDKLTRAWGEHKRTQLPGRSR
jgi:uncharacterized protein YoaH (UPF0181 family)